MSPEGVGGGGGMQGVSDEFTITATTNGIPATCALCCVCITVCVRKYICRRRLECSMVMQYQG